jgi:cytochrome b561
MTTTPHPDGRPAPRHGYSSLQIALHWSIMVLVAANILIGQGMERVFRGLLAGEDLQTYGPAYMHIAIGLTILLLTVMRLVVRINRPVEPAPDSPHRIMATLAKVNHWAFYVLLLAIPVLGIVAWFGGVEGAADLHGLLNWVLLALIALHVLGVIVHHAMGDPILRRMARRGGGT